MSRTDLPVPTEGQDARDRAASAQDRAVEVFSRMGISREAAKAEMERFRGVAEYETRKLFGQRSALRQPAEPLPASKKSRRSSLHNNSPRIKTTRVQSAPQPQEESKSAEVRRPEVRGKQA